MRFGIVAVAVLALVVYAAVLVTGVHHHPASPIRGRTAGAALAPRPTSPLRLVAGSRIVDGLYQGYPHSMPGAVSAAVEFSTELGSTLDPDRAATVARLAADPSYVGAASDAAAGAVSTRRKLGLSAAGPLSPGTAVVLVPVMYQVRDVTANGLTVLLLFDYTATVPAGIQEHLGVTEASMHWTGTDWRLLKQDSADLSALLATPGTAAAAAKGWEAMTGVM